VQRTLRLPGYEASLIEPSYNGLVQLLSATILNYGIEIYLF